MHSINGDAWRRDYRRRAGRAGFAGAVAASAGAALGRVAPDEGDALLTAGLLVVISGLTGLARVWRIGRLVAGSGWRRREAQFHVAAGGPNGQPALLLFADDDEREAVLSISTTVFRWQALRGHEWLWVVGNPQRRFTAVATPDLDVAIVVKRPLLGFWRRRLRRIALSQ